MPKVVHFEIPITEPKRAIPFYENVFGWQINQFMEGYWLVNAGAEGEPGIGGALMSGTPSKVGTVITIGVASIEESRAKVLANEGKVASDVQTIPDVGLFCYVEDTEGNMLGIIQPQMGQQ